jgi:hypothetical protein
MHNQGPLTISVFHILHALFPRHCLLNALTGPRIRSRTLSSNWETPPMPNSSVTSYFSKPRNILLNLPPQRTFDRELFVEMRIDTCNVIFAKR